MIEFTTDGVITLGDLKKFIAEANIPDDAIQHTDDTTKPFCGSGLLYVDKIYYDSTDGSLTFEY
ncbi:hypothetical protein [Zooshikella harenae]|uniref:Uncharacterized protein n=1 Tax=Zooshikella harenae TaxID=2827238 RepID=A0ABS5ZJV1_9GAMM|nr:hypothetical protein [Zooshikella harenae]MBU2714239.1 hypothetical protein [Zooshikella harenae]